jgi:SAM-dependent methyltransferase
MPFRKDTFDGGLMVRVLHHIKKQEEYFKEVSRILKNNSIYIQEFANKRHIKARVRAFFSNDKSVRNEQPYQQPCINLEGAKDDGVYFLNYHPNFVSNLMKTVGFDIKGKQGCSYFRIPFLKKIFGTKILTFFERIFQRLFPKSDIPPSIFFKTKLKKDPDKIQYSKLEEILVCPECKNKLTFKDNSAMCTKCNKEYFKKDGVWDLRVD